MLSVIQKQNYNFKFNILNMNLYIGILLLCSFSISAFSKAPPESFADLSDSVSPAVVNIATSVTVKDSPPRDIPNFPPGSPFEEFFKDFNELFIFIIFN